MVSLDNLLPDTVSVDTPTTATVITITDNDSATLSMADVSVNEGDSTATVTVNLDIDVQGGFTVDASTADGTATVVDLDYTAVTSETLSFNGDAGDTTFTVEIIGDDVGEDTETLTVSLASLTGTDATVELPGMATVTITDVIDNNAVLTMTDATVDEDAGTATVTVTMKGTVAAGFTVDASITGGTATAGEDYTDVTSELSFTGTTTGETQEFMVVITDDEVFEGDETLTISLDNLQITTTGLSVGLPVAATITITDDDDATLTMEAVTVAEGAGTATVTVSLDNAVQGGFTVDASTTDGTATAGQDYSAITSETLTFIGDAGEFQTFTVDITEDEVVEGDETLTVSLANPQDTSVMVTLPVVATITVTDDDSGHADHGGRYRGRRCRHGHHHRKFG